MAFSSISSSKLHCCLVILILIILVFLSLPLLLIYLANDRFEETWQNTTLDKNVTCPKSTRMDDGSAVQCPDGRFACPSCPEICLHQHRMCDGINDCPDRWDESVSICYDSNGLIGTFFRRIWDTRDKLPSDQTVLAKPESCDYEMFFQEQCPCNMTERNVIICEGLGLRTIPDDLQRSVFKIRMSNNSIDSLADINWPRSLTTLVLPQNEIAEIGRAAFRSAPSLTKLYLGHNNISTIDEDAFEFAINLSLLQLESNQLSSFKTRLLRHTPALAMIFLNENRIELPEDTRFSISADLKEITLDHNRISLVRRTYFSQMPRLMWLSLTHNQITFIETESFDGNYELQELNLSFNKLTAIDRRIFAHRLNIGRLYLSGNPFAQGGLPVDAFRDVMELRSLNLTQIEFADLKRETFAYLRHLEFIYFEKFRYCHYAAQVRVCRPITDGLSSIEGLLAFPILKYAVWIVALVCSLGNVFVFIWRSVSPHEDRTLSLFIKNLSLADLMMGVYLSTIGWQDWKFQNNFRNNAIDWMSSWKCSAIGFLAIFSSELSVFILTIITIERYRSIMSSQPMEPAAQKRRARVYVTLAWLFSFLIAFYPLFQWLNRKSDFYATNGLCLPLHIDQPFTHGWQYSAFVYLGVNFLAVLVMVALYARMYTMIIDGRQLSRPVLFKAEKREDAILAIRFFFIVVTDCMCWIPIVAIKIMALLRVNVSASIYGWLVVFIIPINSALNPIVYTLAAPTTLRSAACRLFQRLCFTIDRLTSAGSCSSSSSCSSTSIGKCAAGHLPHGARQPNGAGRRRRAKMGSNSTTTCDTFDTSITSHSKVSFDASLLVSQPQHQQQHFSFAECGEQTGANSTSGRPSGSKESSFSSTSSSSPLKLAATFDGDGGNHKRAPKLASKFHYMASYKRNLVKHSVVLDQDQANLEEADPFVGAEWPASDKRLESSLANQLDEIKIGFRSSGCKSPDLNGARRSTAQQMGGTILGDRNKSEPPGVDVGEEGEDEGEEEEHQPDASSVGAVATQTRNNATTYETDCLESIATRRYQGSFKSAPPEASEQQQQQQQRRKSARSSIVHFKADQ